MSHFSGADWTVIFVYLAGVIALGIWFGKDQQNTRDYFLGSKNIPWWGIGLSIVAAETSAVTIISVPGMAFGTNLAFVQMVIGYVIARVILAVLLVPHYFKGEIYSPYELLGRAFGPVARQMSAVLFLITETLAAGVRVYVACIPIQLMLGIGILPAILLFIGLSLVYTYIGGVKAVIWTDALQFGLFLAGGLFTLFYIPTFFEGGVSQVFHEALAAGKLHWLNTKFSFAAPFNIWMGVIGGTVVTMSTHGAEQLIVQRVLACKSIRDGRRALTLSAVVILPLFLTFLFVGAMLYVYYQHFQPGVPIPESGPGLKKADFIYPIFIITAVPPVLKGFLIVAILSAAMSSVSSALTSLASVSTMDLCKPFLGAHKSEGFFLRFSKFSTIGWALGLIGVAYGSRHVQFVLNAAFTLRGLTAGALLGGLLLAMFGRRGASAPVAIAMFISFLVMVGINYSTKVFWPWYTLIGTSVTILAAILLRCTISNRASPELSAQ